MTFVKILKGDYSTSSGSSYLPWRGDIVQEFIAKKNIERFRSMLEAEVDEGRRRMLEKLIEEEERVLDAIKSATQSDGDQD